VFADVSAMASGAADIVIRDNVADALTIRQGSQRVRDRPHDRWTRRRNLFGQARDCSPRWTITMSRLAARAGVSGPPAANETKVIGNLDRLVNAGAASRVLRLPPTAGSSGLRDQDRDERRSSDAFEIASSTGFDRGCGRRLQARARSSAPTDPAGVRS
jgi:hypothetical protein